MVFIGNIASLHSQLDEEEKLKLFFKSGNETEICKNSILEKSNGDLKITTTFHSRVIGSETWDKIVIIDCAEVEKISVIKR